MNSFAWLTYLKVQKEAHKAAAAAMILAGADVQKKGTTLAKQALEEKDDVILGAVVAKVKQSVLDTLDIDYKRMVAAGLPKAAAAALKRSHEDASMACSSTSCCCYCMREPAPILNYLNSQASLSSPGNDLPTKTRVLYVCEE